MQLISLEHRHLPLITLKHGAMATITEGEALCRVAVIDGGCGYVIASVRMVQFSVWSCHCTNGVPPAAGLVLQHPSGRAFQPIEAGSRAELSPFACGQQLT